MRSGHHLPAERPASSQFLIAGRPRSVQRRRTNSKEPDGWEIYGSPAEPVIATMRQAATTSPVAVDIQPNYLGGFLRATSG
jgi:hypothetical protein